MTPTDRIAVLSARISALNSVPAQAEPPRPYARRRSRCSTCTQEGHNRQTCPFRRLAVWTDGVDHFIAKSAAEARAIALDPIPEDMRDELDFPEVTWTRVPDEPLTLYVDDEPVTWLPRWWIVMNGAGLLAVDGCNLVDGRRSSDAPQPARAAPPPDPAKSTP